MATLSEHNRNIITQNPLGNSLDQVETSLSGLERSYSTVSSLPQDNIDNWNAGARKIILRLLPALLATDVARNLRLNEDNTKISHELYLLYNRVDDNEFNYTYFRPLVQLIINKASDFEIWSAVIDLIITLSKGISFAKAGIDTPVRSSSASQIGIEQTHDEVDQRILEEFTGRIYDNVGGFYKRYFEEKAWSNKATDICEMSMTQYAEGRWSSWPEPSLQAPFFEWFMNFQDIVLSGLRGRYYTSANKRLTGSEANRALDIFLNPANTTLPTDEYDWSNILVIGEHKKNPAEDQATKTLVQLAGYVREVFGSQPERRFIPGFTICGSIMQLWMFDRSGLYNSEKFDIHKEPKRFVKVLAGYAMMSDAELGLNTFIKRDNNSKYILTPDIKIFLENQPIASTKAIVCRGTMCFRGRRSDSMDWEYVVKFAWPSDKRQREGELLKLAKEKGVTGIAIWFNHERITIDGDPDTILYLRRAMKFGLPRRLSKKALWVDSSLESTRAYSKTSLRGRSRSRAAHSIGRGIGAGSTTTFSSGQKRKADVRPDGGSRLRRSKSDSSHASATNMRKDNQLDAISPLSIQESVVDSLADCRNEWQWNYIASIQEARADSSTDCESDTYDNRVHYCLVTSPAGRPLHEYQSVGELLEVLRDAIRGHRSLLEIGKILHQDISENNIIITELSAEEAPKGILIDLDLAKELDSMCSGARHRTGTMQFMAIEVLEGLGHTYRHDLESFFYVFIWMCIRYGYESTGRQNPSKVVKPTTNILRGWYTGTYTEISRNKSGNMGKKQFEKVIAEFAPKFENLMPLARELRSVLFPIRDGDIFTGTFHDNNIMYDGMIDAFSRAIDRLRKEEQVIA